MNTSKKQKWTFKKFTLWGFNFIVGYAFIIGINSSFAPLGQWSIVTLILGGIIAFACGFGFGRLSNKFSTNGGAFLYARKIMGKKMSSVAGFFQYIQAPFIGLSALFGMLWAFQGIEAGALGNLAHSYITYIVALVCFFASWVVLSYGFTTTKLTLYILWALKWAVLIFIIIVALLRAPHFAQNINGANSFKPKGGIHFVSFISSLFTFFFAFGGFEGIATVADDVENPEKNVKKALVTIILLGTLFYIFFYYILLGSLGSTNHIPKPNAYKPLPFNNGGDYNPINELLKTIGITNSFTAGIGSAVILVLIVLSQLANKSTSRIQNGWVNARILSVIAKGGFLPEVFEKVDKYSQFKASLWLDSVITFTLFIIFYPIYYYTKFNIAGALDLYTVSAFFQYLVVMICILKYKITNKKIKHSIKGKKESPSFLTGIKMFFFDILLILVFVFGPLYISIAKLFNKDAKIPKKYLFTDNKLPEIKKFEIFGYFIMCFILILLLTSYFVFGFQKFAGDPGVTNIEDAQIVITTFTYLFLFGVAICLYFVGKKRGWHKRGELYHGEISDLEYAKHNNLNDIEILN